jgi:hypothetical protein
MGTKLSIDKQVSSLEDILRMDPRYFKRIRFENVSPHGIAHHLKLWRFGGGGSSEPVSLQQIKTSGFSFKTDEAYLVLLIYRKDSLGGEVLDCLPNSTWALIESFSNLTPRGMEVPFSSSEPLREVHRVNGILLAYYRQLLDTADAAGFR